MEIGAVHPEGARRTVGLLAGLTALMLVCALSPALPVGADTTSGGTSLPPGWELCILQGVSAPLSQANVADLDEWQAAEGGSTNNTAAYNPFNTARTTDVNGAALPATTSANGFPAFANWLAGCAATVGTLLQPNMWSITAALRTGSVAPPAAFLASVDQSQWCAPSSDGQLCYENLIPAAAGSVASAVLSQSAAREVYGNVKSDVNSYEQVVTAMAADQGLLAARQQQFTAAEAAVSAARDRFRSAGQQLQKIAVDEYVTRVYVSGSYADVKSVGKPFGSQDADGVIAQQYEDIVTADLVARYQSAEAVVKASEAQRISAANASDQANATLASESNTESHSLIRLISDVATMQKAGACPIVTIASLTPTPTTPVASQQSAGTTTTVLSTTTTTTVPSSTTTTVPANAGSAAAPAASAPTANQAGLTQLQGCMAGFAPMGST
jgi:hypothetical protein